MHHDSEACVLEGESHESGGKEEEEEEREREGEKRVSPIRVSFLLLFSEWSKDEEFGLRSDLSPRLLSRTSIQPPNSETNEREGKGTHETCLSFIPMSLRSPGSPTSSADPEATTREAAPIPERFL